MSRKARTFPRSTAISPAAAKNPQIGQPSDVGSSSVFNLFTGQLNISYTPDVFGANRRAVESLHAQEDAQRFALEATYLTLISNLAGAAVQEASLRGQIAATQTIIKVESDVLRSDAQAIRSRPDRRGRRGGAGSGAGAGRADLATACKSNYCKSAICWRR